MYRSKQNRDGCNDKKDYISTKCHWKETFAKCQFLPAQPAQFIPLNLFGFYLTGMEFIFLFIPSGLNAYLIFNRGLSSRKAILIHLDLF